MGRLLHWPHIKSRSHNLSRDAARIASRIPIQIRPVVVRSRRYTAKLDSCARLPAIRRPRKDAVRRSIVKKHLIRGKNGDYLLSEIIECDGTFQASAIVIQWPSITRTIEVCGSSKEDAEGRRFAKIQQVGGLGRLDVLPPWDRIAVIH